MGCVTAKPTAPGTAVYRGGQQFAEETSNVSTDVPSSTEHWPSVVESVEYDLFGECDMDLRSIAEYVPFDACDVDLNEQAPKRRSSSFSTSSEQTEPASPEVTSRIAVNDGLTGDAYVFEVWAGEL
jgi:hypothetical protein